MGEATKIEWTDHTFNPWRGCTKVAAGCANCYAEVNYSVKMHGVKWGPQGTRVRLSDGGWRNPLKWDQFALANGTRDRVFCASLADVFEDWTGPILNHERDERRVCQSCPWRGTLPAVVRQLAPSPRIFDCPECGCLTRMETMADLRADLFKLIDATPNLDWLLLTKRPENIRRMWPSADMFNRDSEHKAFWPNVWLGTSIAEQKDADRNLRELAACRDLAPVLFVSAEPLISQVDLRPWLMPECEGDEPACEDGECDHAPPAAIDWVIVGGESGRGTRPCNIEWVQDIRLQCEAAAVPVFVKQLGSFPTDEGSEGLTTAEILEDPESYRIRSIKDSKGGNPAEWPDELRVRQFPVVAGVNHG